MDQLSSINKYYYLSIYLRNFNCIYLVSRNLAILVIVRFTASISSLYYFLKKSWHWFWIRWRSNEKIIWKTMNLIILSETNLNSYLENVYKSDSDHHFWQSGNTQITTVSYLLTSLHILWNFHLGKYQNLNLFRNTPVFERGSDNNNIII